MRVPWKAMLLSPAVLANTACEVSYNFTHSILIFFMPVS